MANKPFGILSPTLGVKQDYPSILLRDAYLPDALDDIKNIWFVDGEIHSVRKRTQEFDQTLPDPIMFWEQFWKKDQSFYMVGATKRDIFYRDSTNNRMQYITPKYSVGKIRVENASTKIYGGLEVDNCDTDPVAWADGSGGDVTPSRNTTSPKDGTAFVRLTVAAGAGVELLAYHNISSVNLTAYDSIGFWIRSSVALDAGDLKFLLDDTAACATPLETINIPALTANTWTWVNLAFVTPANLTAVISIGITQAIDKGAMTVDIDQIVVGDWADQLKANDFITIGTTYSTADTWYVVSAVNSDTELTLTAVYAGSTATQQAYQARKTYTGTATDWWEAVTFNDQFIMTTGVDNMQAWGGTNQFADLGGSPPKLKHIVVYENYIVGGGSSTEPYTYFWCAVGVETNWSTGDSGSAELDDYYVINKCTKQGGFLIILTERTIEKLWLVGGDLVFNRKCVTDDCGAWAPRSVVSTNSAIYFYAADNTFRCYTGMTWESVSDVFKKYLKDINPEFEKSITGTYVEEHEVILWAVPDAISTGNNNQVVVYDLKSPIEIDNWSKFDMQVYAFGFYEVETSLTWDTWGFTTWDSITWDKWDTRTGQEGAPRELCTDYNGDTFRLFSAETDDGVAYDREFVLATDLTKNKSGINYVKRLTKMRCVFRNEDAGTVSVYVKRDYESSFQLIGSISLDGSNEFLFLDVYPNYTAKNFLIKFSAQNRFRFVGIIFDEESYEILGNR